MPAALLIDDEPPACAALRELLGDHPEITIVAEAGTLAEARRALARDNYDVVFLDVQLRGGTGFDLVSEVRPGARIIFVTAYDQHALRAFEVNALDYLLKPVAPDRLARALARIASANGSVARLSPEAGEGKQSDTRNAPRSAAPTLTLDDRVLVRLGTAQERFITLGEIRCISSCENYSELHLGGPSKLLVRRTLKQWEDLLPPTHFVRAHRNLVVNLRHVERIDRATVSTYHLHLRDVPEPQRASFRYIDQLRRAARAS